LRDKNPYEEASTASDPSFWAKFQQDYYAIVIIKKPKITHKAQYVFWGLEGIWLGRMSPFLMQS
jgi:hypothetical protein